MKPMPIVRTVLLVFAFVLFVLAGAGISHPRINLTALGLAFATAAFLF